MTRLIYFLSVILVLGGGLATVIYFGQQSEAVPVMKMTAFPDLKSYSVSVSERLREEIKAHPVLVLGVLPERSEGFEIAEHFLNSLQEDGLRYDVIVVETGFGPEGFLPDATSVSLVRERSRLIEGLKNARARDLRTVIVVPADIAPLFSLESLSLPLKEALGGNLLSLSFSPLPLTRADEKNFPLTCKTEAHDRAGMRSLGCFVLSVSRALSRQAWDLRQVEGSLDQMGPGDYVGLFHDAEVPEETP